MKLPKMSMGFKIGLYFITLAVLSTLASMEIFDLWRLF
jgi:hypothetical protein